MVLIHFSVSAGAAETSIFVNMKEVKRIVINRIFNDFLQVCFLVKRIFSTTPFSIFSSI